VKETGEQRKDSMGKNVKRRGRGGIGSKKKGQRREGSTHQFCLRLRGRKGGDNREINKNLEWKNQKGDRGVGTDKKNCVRKKNKKKQTPAIKEWERVTMKTVSCQWKCIRQTRSCRKKRQERGGGILEKIK